MNIPKTFLTEAIDNNSILRILTQSKSIDINDPKYSYYEKLAKWASENSRQLNIKNIYLNDIKLSDNRLVGKQLNNRYNSLGSLLDALKNLMDKQGRYGINADMSKLIQQTTLDILVNLSGIKDGKTPLEEPEDAKDDEDSVDEEEPRGDENVADSEELHKGMDWTAEKARRLANAKDPSAVLDKFYNDYYNIEYAGGTEGTAGDPSIVAKLKSLDKILIPEFNALGYNPEVNPLAQFLKILIALRAKDKTDNIFDKLNTNNYGAIHNSFKDKYITGNMLGNYDSTKILFCSDLYNYKGLDIVNYLSLQNDTINAAKNNAKYSDDKLLVAKMFIQQDVQGKNYEDKMQNLLDLSKVRTLENPKSEVKLKSIAEIRELYRHLFKSVPKKPLNKGAVPEIVRLAIEQGAVRDMIYYIINISEFDDEYEQEIKKWLIKEPKYVPDEKLYKISKKILSGYNMNNATANLALIIARLQKHYEESKK